MDGIQENAYSYIDTRQATMERIIQIKANPKTYRTYTYSVKESRAVVLETFGNRIYFPYIPTPIRLRFNEPENDFIYLSRPIGIKQEFYRVYLDWDAASTDVPLAFIAGFDIEMMEVPDIYKRPINMFYHDTPLGVDSAILGTFDSGNYKELLFDFKSDIDGFIHVWTSHDGVDFYNEKVIPVAAGVGDYKSLPVESNFAQVIFEKAVPGTPQTLLKISLRGRL